MQKIPHLKFLKRETGDWLLLNNQRYSMDAELHADSESGIENCVRGFAGDRQGLKDGDLWARWSV
jgi:hypothetical protein